MKFIKEFKEFAIKGNVVDLAVGVVIGAAFNKIVTSLVADLIMPPIGMLIAGIDFKDVKWEIGHAYIDAAGVKHDRTTINVGNFINTLIDFALIALAVFLLVKFINTLRRKEEAAPAEPAAPTTEEKLLTEIRDLLARQQGSRP